MKEIDYSGWERRETYEYFSRMSHPFYMVTFRQDVTGLYRYTKAHGLSFYEGMIWACTQAVNSVPAFRIVMREGRPAELDMRHPSFTDLAPDSEQFQIITMKHITDIAAFCREASRLRRAQDIFLDESKETDDLIYYSCLPWIELTAAVNERDLSAPGALDDSIPRITWGKYIEENGRKKLGISMDVNHRFTDGIHIGRFAQNLEKWIDQLERDL